MGDAKDLKKNLAAIIAAIFGVRSDAYSLSPPPSLLLHFITKKRTTPPKGGDDIGTVANMKKRRRDNKMDNSNG